VALKIPSGIFFTITDGQTNIGFIKQIGARFTAIGTDEQHIGTFGSLKEAAGAVSAISQRAAHGGSHA